MSNAARGDVYWLFDGSKLLAFDWDIVKIGIKAADRHYYFYLDPFAGLDTDSRDVVLAGVFDWSVLWGQVEARWQDDIEAGDLRAVSHIDLFWHTKQHHDDRSRAHHNRIASAESACCWPGRGGRRLN